MAEDGSQRGLVERAQRGDADAFARLVERHLDSAWRFVRSIGSGHVDVEDVVQEAFVMAWRDLPRLRDAEAFEPWLRAVLVHATQHELRRANRVRLIPLAADAFHDELTPGAPPLADPAPDVASSMVNRDIVRRAFGRLTLEERTVLVLHHLEGWPLERIAIVIGHPVGTVKSRVHAARNALRAALAAEDREMRGV